MISFKQRVSLIIATGFGTGYLPVAPGSWGSLTAIVLGWWSLTLPLYGYAAIVVIIFIAGTWSAKWADPYFSRKTNKEHDNKYIVIDEWVGQLITLMPLLYFGRSIWTLAIGLFLFRAFDTAKFGLAGYWDRHSSHWGVILDDVFAGAHAAIALSLMLWILGQYQWWSGILQLSRHF